MNDAEDDNERKTRQQEVKKIHEVRMDSAGDGNVKKIARKKKRKLFKEIREKNETVN